VANTLSLMSGKGLGVLKPVRLSYIGRPEDVLAWRIETDFSQGGNSVASLEQVEDCCIGYSVLFQGSLQHLRELDYEGKLFCEVVSNYLPKKKFKKYNGIRISVKSDGNQYILGIISSHSMSLLHYYVCRDLGTYTGQRRRMGYIGDAFKQLCDRFRKTKYYH